MTINELKIIVAEMIEEAKKGDLKAEKMKNASGEAPNAYGYYDENLDFSPPLGAYNRLKQQGQVNWGPHTTEGQKIDQNFANPNTRLEMKNEEAIRSIVREVVENGLVPADSAWAPMLEKNMPKFGTIWEAAAWYMVNRQNNGVPEAAPTKDSLDKTKYGDVQKHGYTGEKKQKVSKPSTKNGRSA